MRHYEIRTLGDEFVFECESVPPETTTWGWLNSFRLIGSEAEMHKAAIFARSLEAAPMEGLYERTEAHLGRVLA